MIATYTIKKFVFTCVLDNGKRVWFKKVNMTIDENPEFYLGLNPEISYTLDI